MSKRLRLYVGHIKSGLHEIFYCSHIPTERSHGNKYRYVIGPFRTLLAAEIMARHGENNPHLQHVADAELFAKSGRVMLRREGFDV